MSLTNHSYWNLNKSKKETIFNHDLKINSEKYLEVNNKLIPTGKFKKVKNEKATTSLRNEQKSKFSELSRVSLHNINTARPFNPK